MAEMHMTVIRFGADLWRLIEGEAARQEVSVAEWVRTAAAMRIGFQAATDDDQLRAGVVQQALDVEGRDGRRRFRRGADSGRAGC